MVISDSINSTAKSHLVKFPSFKADRLCSEVGTSPSTPVTSSRNNSPHDPQSRSLRPRNLFFQNVQTFLKSRRFQSTEMTRIEEEEKWTDLSCMRRSYEAFHYWILVTLSAFIFKRACKICRLWTCEGESLRGEMRHFTQA